MKKKDTGPADALEYIMSGKRLTTAIKTKRGDFTVAFPLPRDLREIALATARSLDGVPESSFNEAQLSNIRAYATLDHLVIDGPKWWEDLESAEDCPDDELILTLYRGYLRFYQATQKSFARSKFGRAAEVGTVGAHAAAVGDGAFSGIAHGSGAEESDG